MADAVAHPHASTFHASATGIPSGKLGMWLFLASEVMFFTGLIGAFVVLRMGHPGWPGPEGHLSVPIGTVNTLILICSSTAIVLSLGASARGAMRAVQGWLLATIGLGSAFLVIKGFEYAAKFSHHIVPSTNVFWSCYFALTGFHALHVLGGIIFNLWVLAYSAKPSSWALHGHRLELAGLYWHFVDIVWIFLFPLLYLF
jgi:heme/copper-type cytochrome/quinol oxidase subunit 3